MDLRFSGVFLAEPGLGIGSSDHSQCSGCREDGVDSVVLDHTTTHTLAQVNSATVNTVYSFV